MTEATASAEAGNAAEASAETGNAQAVTQAATQQESDWRASLPDDIRSHASLSKFTTTEALAKSYVNLERMLGSEKIALPKSADDKDGWEKVYKALGRPDEPTAYEFKKLDDLPEGFEYSHELEGGFKDAAHKAGLSVAQAQHLRDWFVGQMAGQFQASKTDPEAAMAETLATLQKEWGNALGQKIESAKHAVKSLIGEEFLAALDETGLGNDPRLIKGFAKLAELTGADKEIVGTGAMRETPDQLKDRIREFEASNREALFDKLHPDHVRRVQQRAELYKQLFPEQAA